MKYFLVILLSTSSVVTAARARNKTENPPEHAQTQSPPPSCPVKGFMCIPINPACVWPNPSPPHTPHTLPYTPPCCNPSAKFPLPYSLPSFPSCNFPSLGSPTLNPLFPTLPGAFPSSIPSSYAPPLGNSLANPFPPLSFPPSFACPQLLPLTNEPAFSGHPCIPAPSNSSLSLCLCPCQLQSHSAPYIPCHNHHDKEKD